MKDFIQAKIAEARDQGRDIPPVIEEMFMHIAEAIDGKKDPEPEPAKES